MHQATTDMFDGLDMSPRTAAAIAARSRRTPHSKGRFDPSEPLHMTTRHAARNGRVNGTPSPNGSFDDQDGLAGSFDDINAMSYQSLGSPNSAKGRRISATSVNGASAAKMSFETQSLTDQDFERSHSKPTSPVFPSTSPTRKRKRSTPTPPESLNGLETSLVQSVTDMMEQDPRDFVEVVHPDELSDRVSDGSVESDEQFAGDYLGATQSTENTPAVTPLGSQAVSPVSEDSNPELLFPSKRPSVSKTEVTKPTEADEADGVEDAEELVDVDEVEDVDDVEDGDDQTRDDLDGKPRKRLAGRRRAEHHDPQIEATMRRQLAIKSAFRAIARALKPVLEEISHKTVENLEEDPHLHEQVVEHLGTEEEAGIQKLLDDALARRKAQLDAQFRWNQANLRKTLEGEDAVRRSRCQLQIADLRDLQLDRLEHDLLGVARNAQVISGDQGYETDDEADDVIPRPHGVNYPFERTGALDSKYDSRSRLALECEKAIHDLQTRFDMFKMLKEVQEEDRPDGMTAFTTMDSTAREAAEARRESVMNTKVLADAAAEQERVDQIPVVPVVPNEQAIGLQILGDVAGHSLRATDRPATPPQEAVPPPRMTPPSQMPPPPPSNRLPMSFEGQPHQMSPPSAPYLERPTLPSASPLRPPPSRERLPSQSPRKEPMIMSPIYQADRGTTLPPFHMQPRDAEQELRHESLPPPPPPHESLPPPPPRPPQQSRDIFGRDRSHRDIFGREILRPEPTEPPHFGAQVREEPAWDHYGRSLKVDRSPRPVSHPDRSIHEFSQGGPLLIERVEASEPQERPRHARGPSNHGTFMIDPALMGSSPHTTHRPFSQAPPMVEPPPARPPPQKETRGPPVHQSPLVDPAFGRSLLNDPRDEPRHPPHRETQTSINHESPMIDPALTRTLLQEEYCPPSHTSLPFQPIIQPPWEAPSSPGAADARETGEPSPLLAPRDNAVEELSRKPRSRTSSIMSQSTTTEASPDASVAGDSAKRRSNKSGAKQVFGAKPTKDQRKGSTRRIWKEHNPGTSRRSQNGKGEGGGPAVYRFRLNSIESTPATPWSSSTNKSTPRGSHGSDGPPAVTSYGPPPPQPGHPLPPPPPGMPYPYPYDHNQAYQHRNSFPQPGSPWAQHPAPSPLYAVPPSTQPPPPPPAQAQPQPGGGPPPDQWPSPSVFAPALARPAQTPRNNQQPAHPPSLAPATPDTGRALAAGGPAANHLPAFAQQQRNQEANPRRRAHSEIQGHSFKHWAPRNLNR